METEIDKKINKMIKEKIDSSQDDCDINSLKTIYDKFINPKQECYPSAMSSSFLLDDIELYKNFLNEYLNNETLYKNNLINKIWLVDFFINTYFGTTLNEAKRREINNSNFDKHSINKYKEQGCAMCFERSTLAHNLFQLIGLKSKLITKDNHAYIIIEGNKSFVFYDPANPTFANEKGKETHYPSILIKPKETLEDFFYGNKATLKLNDSDIISKAWPDAKDIRIPPVTYKALNLNKDKFLI